MKNLLDELLLLPQRVAREEEEQEEKLQSQWKAAGGTADQRPERTRRAAGERQGPLSEESLDGHGASPGWETANTDKHDRAPAPVAPVRGETEKQAGLRAQKQLNMVCEALKSEVSVLPAGSGGQMRRGPAGYPEIKLAQRIPGASGNAETAGGNSAGYMRSGGAAVLDKRLKEAVRGERPAAPGAVTILTEAAPPSYGRKTAEELDRQYRRDARRYDGGFPLY